MTRSYLIKWDGGQIVLSDLQTAIKKADEKKGTIFIADGSYTKSLDGIIIYHFNDANVE